MAVLLSIATAFAVFIISDIRQAQYIDDSIIAYHGAEAGLERTIFLFRKASKEMIGGFSGVHGALTDNDRSGDWGDKTANWNIEGSTDYETNVFRQRLYNGSGIKLYFLGRSMNFGNSRGNDAESVGIEWYRQGTPKMQVSFTQLDLQPKNIGTGSDIYVSYTDLSSVELSDSSVSSPAQEYCYNFGDRLLGGGSPDSWISDYVMEIKTLGSGDDYIDNLLVKVYNQDGCNGSSVDAEITNITIRSEGIFNGARQEIIAHLPPRDPLSGLLGFVLFAEQDITKSY